MYVHMISVLSSSTLAQWSIWAQTHTKYISPQEGALEEAPAQGFPWAQL